MTTPDRFRRDANGKQVGLHWPTYGELENPPDGPLYDEPVRKSYAVWLPGHSRPASFAGTNSAFGDRDSAAEACVAYVRGGLEAV